MEFDEYDEYYAEMAMLDRAIAMTHRLSVVDEFEDFDEFENTEN